MKPMTAEWVEKAEGDFAMVLREARARKNPCYDGACYHAQQCAEKYLKARLCESEIAFAKIHDLVALLNQIITVEPTWQQFTEDMAYLSDFAISFRYPGETADKTMAADARQRCRKFRKAARATLGLHTE
jgi:HEPN domain-containing protein